MGFLSRVFYRRPEITPASIVEKGLIKARLEKKGLTVTRLSVLSRDQRKIVLALAERIRIVADCNRMALITPSLEVLENLADFLIQHNIDVEKIPFEVMVSFKNSSAVSLGKQTLDFEKLDSVIRANIDRMRPPSPAS